ncbi:MAG: methyltransferase family protein [Anaerolineales bacterium]|jgi:protein-S-isoprenylcysteine O-methyltransferase Ste14
MDIFAKWQRQDTPEKNRIPALIVGALIFPISAPALIVFFAPHIDVYLGWGSFFRGWPNFLIGVLSVLTGGASAFWTIIEQIRLASGTPFPMLPTKQLLVAGPFAYCRNPMTLGTILAYAGIAIWIGSPSAVLAVAAITATLVGYLKCIEEKELLLRFGDEYAEYKKKTPFMIPMPPRKNR